MVSFAHEATVSNMFKRNSRVSTNNFLRQHDAEVTTTAAEIHCELVWKLCLLLNRHLKPWRDGNSWYVALVAFPSQLRKLYTREDIGQKHLHWRNNCILKSNSFVHVIYQRRIGRPSFRLLKNRHMQGDVGSYTVRHRTFEVRSTLFFAYWQFNF